MSEVTEETKREVLKLAVQLTQGYVKNRTEILNLRDLQWLGMEEKQAGHNLPEIVEAIYDHLLGIMTR
ncbi:hypothetical protein N5C38_08630 [Pseudomonas chengduensis]|jgi:hypothetical protein|nr:hypothetical protein [Pseudomonas chengduensis]MDH1211119.1 hypothetical protein [Pseudomonas chengduensis]